MSRIKLLAEQEKLNTRLEEDLDMEEIEDINESQDNTRQFKTK